MAKLGDIAIIGFQTDPGTTSKSFVFVLLADLAGEVIRFTDNGWLAAGSFRANEGFVDYTVPAGTPAGTVVRLEGVLGNFNLAAGGDLLIAFTGEASSPNLLFALDFADNNATYAGDATSSNTSAVPTGLTLGENALAFALDNAAYAGPTTGSRDQILAAIADESNWRQDDVGAVAYPAAFTLFADTAPRLSVGDITFSEGDNGSKVAQFTVTREGGEGAFAVNFSTADGTASGGVDYETISGTVDFAAGQTSATVFVTVSGDSDAEDDETFFLNLSDPTGGATLADAQGQATIINDDARPISVAIGDASVVEGDAGETLVSFAVTRSGGTGAFSVAFESVSNTAVAGADFLPTSGVLDFAEGETTRTISVAVNGDTAAEPNERFFVSLSSATDGATLSDSVG